MPRKKATPDPTPEAASGPHDGAPPDFDFEPDLDDVEALFDEGAHRLELAAAEAFDRLSEAATQLAGQARHVYNTTQDYVRRHPGGPLLGALAFGVVLGVLLSRK